MTDQESSTSGGAADPGSEDSRPRESQSAVFVGTAGGDTIQGSSASDTIDGGAGDDNLFGGDGSDTIVGGSGSDFIDGEQGTDTVDYNGETAGVTVNLSTGSAFDGSGGTDTLSSIENIIGSAFADTLIGSTADNVITGGTDTDTLEGRGGSDTLDGGDNTDTVSYANAPGGTVVNLTTGLASDGYGRTDVLISIENVIGSPNGDTITGDTIANQIFAGSGNDSVFGLAGNDQIEGQGGADTLDGGEGDDQLEGGAGADILIGGAGDDSLIGGAGSDVIQGGAGTDTLFLEVDGQAGADATVSTIVNLTTGVVGSDGIVVTAGGAALESSLTDGEAASNTSTEAVITGSFQGALPIQNTSDGGTIADRDFVRVDLTAQVQYTFDLRGADSGGGTLLNPFLILRDASGNFITQNDNVTETTTDARISFTPSVSGSYYLEVRSFVTDDTGSYTLTAVGTGVDTISGIENVFGSNQDDTITGNSGVNELTGGNGADTLNGMGGNDILNGGSGADTLNGGAGDDTLIGGAGRDTIDGGSGTDTLSYALETTRLQMDLALDTARTTADNVDTITNVEIITGTDLGDTMAGDRDANTLDGGDGDDVISGAGGDDTLTGGLGNDDIEGGSGDDVINGGDGNDIISGGLGDDTIDGGLGDDTIEGGQGYDVITFANEWGNDRVTASETGAIINLTDIAGVDVNAGPSGNDVNLTFGGRASMVTLVNFVGNEGNFIVLDEDGYVVNVNGSGTTVDTALKLRPDDSVTARVDAGGNNPIDHYAVTAPTDGQFSLSVSGAVPNTTVQFLNTAGGIIATTTTDSNGDASVMIQATRSETYVAAVSTTGATDYAASVSFTPQNLSDSLAAPVNVNTALLLEGLTLDLASNASDFYRVVAPDDMTLVVNTDNVTGDLDIRIYNSLGVLLNESAQVGTVAESLTFTVTGGEAYIVEVVARDASVTANLQVYYEDLDQSGSNGSIETAQNISANSSLSGSVGIDPNFADYFTFTVATAGIVTINLQNLQDDLRIDLFDADGVRIGQAQTAGAVNELLNQSIGAGTYFIGIVATDTLVSSAYDLDVSFSVPDAADTPSTATDFGGFPLDTSQTVGAGSDSADYFAFTAPSDGTITASLTNLTGNIGLEAFDSNGIRLADDALANTLDKTITFAATSGQTYTLGAIPASEGANGSYRIQGEFFADAGNALTSPTNVDVNFSATEGIGFNGDTGDYFRIFPTQSGTLTVDLTDLSAPVNLRLYTTDGTRLTSSDNTGSTPEQISFDLNANTGYVIEVLPTSSAAQGFYDITSSYTVSSSAQSAAQVAVVDEDQVGS